MKERKEKEITEDRNKEMIGLHVFPLMTEMFLVRDIKGYSI
jgi:hypothetical protein